MFTNKPLPDIICHGPILPLLPNCYREVDVTPGCHNNAQLFLISNRETPLNNECEIKVKPSNDESAIAFHQVVDFFEQGGLKFDFSKFNWSNLLRDRSTENKVNLLKKIQEEIQAKANQASPSRAMHFQNAIFTKDFNLVEYVNLYHQRLAAQDENPLDCALEVKDYNPKPTQSLGFSLGIFNMSNVSNDETHGEQQAWSNTRGFDV